MKDNLKTLEITNFNGNMSSYVYGDINSGLTNVVQVSGYDPFTKPGLLTWEEEAVQIDPNGAVITDLIVSGKTRVESGITYVYAVGHTGRVYKIQVNDPNTYNPNYDNPTLLTTLTINSPTFTRGGFLDFFDSVGRIYISHDFGVSRINFDGTSEAFIGDIGQWTQNVPKPLNQFVGKLYIGNGNNLAEIDSTSTVTSYAKLSPAFPSGTQVRDLDVTPDGNYLQATVTALALADITSVLPDTSLLSPANSYVFLWNGADNGYTSYNTYLSAILTSNSVFGNSQYVFGFDFLGGAVYNPTDKFLTSTTLSAFTESPLPNATSSLSNLVAWMTPLSFQGSLSAILCVYGSISGHEIKEGYYCLLDHLATGTETDINRIPCMIIASNFAQGSSSSGYANNNFGNAKIYFSTLESSALPTKKYKFYTWTPAPTGIGASGDGVYQTQQQHFSKKINIKEVRVYGEPWVAGNSFQIDLIGSALNPMTGGTKTFTVGTNVTAGTDFDWYNPQMAPTYTVGVRISNLGDVNNTINKIEIDYSPAGK